MEGLNVLLPVFVIKENKFLPLEKTTISFLQSLSISNTNALVSETDGSFMVFCFLKLPVLSPINTVNSGLFLEAAIKSIILSELMSDGLRDEIAESVDIGIAFLKERALSEIKTSNLFSFR